MSRYKEINSLLFVENRERLKKLLLPDSLVILNSNDQFPRNGDQTMPYRQNSDLFWASGLDQEKTVLLIYPDCPLPKYREVAFIVKTNPQIAVWEGYKYTQDHASRISGIKTICWLEEFEMILHELMTYTANVYLNANEYPRFKTEVEYRDMRFTKWLREQYPNHNYLRLAPLLTEMRLIKTDREMELISEACRITGDTFLKLLNTVKPGIMEYEIQAVIDYEFIRNRANGHAYEPIVASGPNALCLHYTDNNDECKDGDLLLMDFGAEYANYAADLSRTIPVNGKFTKRQKDCYEAVLNVFKLAKQLIKPGLSINEINSEVNKLMESEMISLGLFTKEEFESQPSDQPLFAKYFMHGTSHFLGLDVHDAGTKHVKLKPGMVITCEPGIYISEENLGIRIETDLLITENGNMDLMENLPAEVGEIETLMNC